MYPEKQTIHNHFFQYKSPYPYFFPGCSVFFPPSKPTSLNFNSTRIEHPHKNQLRLMWFPASLNIVIYPTGVRNSLLIVLKEHAIFFTDFWTSFQENINTYLSSYVLNIQVRGTHYRIWKTSHNKRASAGYCYKNSTTQQKPGEEQQSSGDRQKANRMSYLNT